MEDIVDAAVCDLSPEVIRQTIVALESNVLRGTWHCRSCSHCRSNGDMVKTARAKGKPLKTGWGSLPRMPMGG